MDSIIILPTIECNIDCGHCGQGRDLKGLTMEDSLLERLLNEVIETGIPDVRISGGEVTSLKYWDRLLGVLRQTKVGAGRDLTIETSGWWGASCNNAAKMVKDFESANVGQLLVSTDKFHEKYVPLRSLANLIQAIDGSQVNINVINVRSFKSTYHDDVDLIKRLAELTRMPISQTLVVYADPKNIHSPKFQFHAGFADIFQLFSGFEGLLSNIVHEVYYSLGENSQIHPLYGPIGINVKQMWAIRAGVADENVVKNDLIHQSNDSRRRLFYDTKLSSPMVMPDGSLMAECYWTQMNDRFRARLGVYPEMSLTQFEHASQSFLYMAAKQHVDIATYIIPGAAKLLSKGLRIIS